MEPEISIILPAKNESESLKKLLPHLIKSVPNHEIIVVNDGSDDDTVRICESNEIEVINHAYSKGNGAAIKTGARHARGNILVFMDADGQHNPEDIKNILDKLEEGFDMVVGARSASSQASLARLCANTFYNRFASFIVGQRIDDLTSGFRAVRTRHFKEFLHLLPNGFSYPATCTMAFFRSGYSVGYIPIKAEKRLGKSHIKLIRDGTRFVLIMFKIGTLYSPLKIFLPLSMLFFSTGICYYAYTFITAGRFTNMSALLFTTSVTIFLMGLVSEQITSLIYSKNQDR